MAGLSAILSLILARIATEANSRSDHPSGQPPLIYEGPSAETVVFNVGQRMMLPCTAHGSPSPRYHWYRNGRLLDANVDMESSFFMLYPPHLGTLHIKARHQLTEGYYQCLATNDHGTDMSNITHLQQAVFEDLQPRRIIHNLTVTEGRHLVLRCNNIISVPPPTFDWFTMDMTSRVSWQPHHSTRVKTNERVTLDDTGGLVITAVTKADARNDVIFKCEAYNYVIRQTNAGGYFRILLLEEPYRTGSAPEVVYSSTKVTGHVGRNVTLTCLFSGRPLAKMSWTRSGGAGLPSHAVMADYGRRLVLSKVTFDDEGYYICSAENDNGVTQTKISLTVVASPRIILAPVNRNSTEGSSASFSCQGHGRPLTYVTWFVNARPINSSSVGVSWEIEGETLTLFNLQLEDSCIITCNISNDFGYVLSSAYLMVFSAEPTTASTNVDTSLATETSVHDLDIAMTTVTSLYDVTVSTENEDISSDESETEKLFPQTEDYVTDERFLSEYELQALDSFRGRKNWKDVNGERSGIWVMDSNFMKVACFSIPVLLLIGFGFIVWRRYRNKKTTYRVEELEKKHGSNNADYDSEDSGYDEQRAADRRIKSFKVAEKEPN